MKRFKKGIAFLMIVLMAITLSACGGKSNTPDSDSSNGYLYSAETISAPEGTDYIDCFGYTDGYLYISYSGHDAETGEGAEAEAEVEVEAEAEVEVEAEVEAEVEVEVEAEAAIKDIAEYEEYEDYGYWSKMAKLDVSSGQWTEIPYVSQSDNSNIMYIEPNDDGSVWILENIYIYEEDEEGEIIADENSYQLVRISDTGETVDTIDISYLSQNSGEYFYIQAAIKDQEGNWYFRCSTETEEYISVADSAGAELFRISDDRYLEGMVKTNTGDVAAFIYNWEDEENYGYELTVIDKTAQDWGETYSLELNYAALSSGPDYYIYANDNTNLYGYDIESGNKTVLLNWVDNDINGNNMMFLQPISETQILCAVNVTNSDTYSVELLMLTKTDNVPGDQEVITLGGIGLYDEIKSEVIKFNKSNEDYRIRIVDYMADDDYDAAAENMNTAIMAGDIPDIMVMNGYNMTAEKYIAKGILEDLYPYIENDPDLNREDFVQSALNAMDTDGHLYEIIDGFFVSSLVGKSEAVGTEPGWTIAEFYDFIEAHPDADYPMGYYYIQNDILNEFFSYSSEDFVDWNTGKCNFVSGDFAKLLEFSATLPAEYPEGDDYLYDAQLIKDGRQLLYNVFITGTSDIQYYKSLFGGDVTFIGFPVIEGVGTSLQYSEGLTISAQSEHKDIAWEFIRSFLLEDHQKALTKQEWKYPIMQQQLDAYMDAARGKSDEIVSSWGWGEDSMVDIMGPTDEEIDAYIALINSIDRVSHHNAGMTEIITEEAASFFAGDKSSEEVAEIIQNRMETYVNEQR